MSSTATNSTGRLIVLVMKWLLAMGMLAALWWMSRDSLAKLQNRHFVWQAFAIAFATRFLSLLVSFSRWRLLVQGIGLPISFRETFRLGMLSEAMNLMGPGAVGGDLIKAALLAKNHPNRRASASATVFLDRVLGMWGLFVLGAGASMIPVSTKIGSELDWAVWLLWAGTFAGLVGIGMMLVPAFTHSWFMHWLSTWKLIGRIVKELMESVQMYQGQPQVVILAVFLSMIGHFGALTSFYFCAQAVHRGQTIPTYVDHLVGLPLPVTLGAVVPTPGGVGALEGAVAWFYEQHQLNLIPNSAKDELATAFSNGILTALVYRLTVMVGGAIGVIYYFTSRAEIRQVVHDAEIESVV